MSKYYKKPSYTSRHQQLQWINTMVSVHDLHCYCDKPLNHIIIGIIDQEPTIQFDKEDSKKIEKCLTTTDGEDVLDDFGDGELEKLFADDIDTTDDTPGATTG